MYSRSLPGCSCKITRRGVDKRDCEKHSCQCDDQQCEYNVEKSLSVNDYAEFKQKLKSHAKILFNNQFDTSIKKRCQDVIVFLNYVVANWKTHGFMIEYENFRLAPIIHAKIIGLSDQWPEDEIHYSGDELYDYYHGAIFGDKLCTHTYNNSNGQTEQCVELKSDTEQFGNMFCSYHKEEHQYRMYKVHREVMDCLQYLPSTICEVIGRYVINREELYAAENEKGHSACDHCLHY
jgi:hypothetical protein